MNFQEGFGSDGNNDMVINSCSDKRANFLKQIRREERLQFLDQRRSQNFSNHNDCLFNSQMNEFITEQTKMSWPVSVDQQSNVFTQEEQYSSSD